jgi:protocatechuate 3,4-dioxygenase, beta subunit
MAIIPPHLSCLALLLLSFAAGCHGQTKTPVGGSFENQDYMYLQMPQNISSTDTSPGWTQQGQKILVTGIVYQHDGQTPAPNVLVYYYHTNTAGRYEHIPGDKRSMPPNQQGQTHGSIRGWVKTDANGKYAIYTIRPGSYPSSEEPAHIHLNIKEPNNIKEYYIDDIVFDDDKLLTSAKRQRLTNRGGSGVLRMVQKGNLHAGERNIILGLNVTAYPD